MKTIAAFVAAAGIAFGAASVAQAQSYAPTIPSPTNPTPMNPIATDGSPLPHYNSAHGYEGRSVFAPATVVAPEASDYDRR